MSDSGLLAARDTAERPSFSFTKVNRDRTSERYALDSVTVQGVTEDGSPFSKARIPVDEDDRVVISAETFGDDTELAWLVANLLEEEGWEYVDQ
ncbi:MAG: hypothetical protein ABEI99_05360 [Halobaculum sp.]